MTAAAAVRPDPGPSASLASAPRDADMVFGRGFLKNPAAIPMLQPRIGLALELARFIEKDPDDELFMQGSMLLLRRPVPGSFTERRIMQPLPSGAQVSDTRRQGHIANMAQRFQTAHLAGAKGETRTVGATLHRTLGDSATPRLEIRAGVTGAGAHS